MSAPRYFSPASTWHHRVLGTLWALLGGAACLIGLYRAYRLGHSTDWLSVSVGLVGLFTGIGFMVGRTWARRFMVLLAIGAGLVFADMMLLAASVGNRLLLHWMLVACVFAVYTLGFIGVSASMTHD